MFFCFAGGILQWIFAAIDRIWIDPSNTMLFTIEMSTGWILIGMGFLIQQIQRLNRDK